jgi:uncharacterized protein (TIGR02466 family)
MDLKKIFKTEIFTASIYSFKLDLDLKAINDYCYFYSNNKKSVKKSNSNGFQSEDVSNNSDIINLLKNTFLEKTNIVSKEIYKINNNLKISNIWFNINKYKDYNMEHDHPNSILSGVFYSKIPKDSGKLVFKSSENIGVYLSNISILEYNSENSTKIIFNTDINYLHIFPSWLKHYVEPNMSNEDRISLSFNTNIV